VSKRVSRKTTEGFARLRNDFKNKDLDRRPTPEARAEERRLLAAARDGDARAMRQLLDRVSGTVYRFGRSFCRDPHDAEDVMQEVFVALVRGLPGLRGEASLSTWAFVVARNACTRWRRRRVAEPRRLASLDADGEARAVGGAVDHAADPARIAETDELRLVLQDAIRMLPPVQRDVLLLRDVEGRSAREVASALRIREPAVKSRLHRARLTVRKAVEAYRQGRGVSRPSRPGCPDTPALLSRFIEGELRAGDCAEIERHVSECGGCRDACAALRDTLRACRRWGSAPIPRALRARLRRTVREAVNATRGVARRPRPRLRRPPARRAGVAAGAARP
jgi:RNA polymerase sigma-70 factor, ECF subfamily